MIALTFLHRKSSNVLLEAPSHSVSAIALLISVTSSFKHNLKAFNISINLQFKTMPKDRTFQVGYRVVTLMANNLNL